MFMCEFLFLIFYGYRNKTTNRKHKLRGNGSDEVFLEGLLWLVGVRVS